MIIVYIAGPLSGSSAWKRQCNRRNALALSLEVHKAGFAFICVHAWGTTFWEEIDEESALAADFELVSRCDAVLLVDGWERSRGTAREIVHAHQTFVPVFTRLEDLQRWARRDDFDPVDRVERRRLAVECGALVPGSP